MTNYTLTTGDDTVVGTSGDDTISAPSAATLNADDKKNGDSGAINKSGAAWCVVAGG